MISPEFTKPTTMTVVAEELCITAVTPRPRRKPDIFLLVILPRMVLSLLPARFSSASPMSFMPKRKRLRPPMRVRKSNMFICRSLTQL
jgi:hypothetical protein